MNKIRNTEGRGWMKVQRQVMGSRVAKVDFSIMTQRQLAILQQRLGCFDCSGFGGCYSTVPSSSNRIFDRMSRKGDFT